MSQETVKRKKNPGEWLIYQGRHPHWTGNRAQGCLIVLMSAFLVAGAIIHKHEVFGPELPEKVQERMSVFKYVFYMISFFFNLLYNYEVFIYNPYYRMYLDPAKKKSSPFQRTISTSEEESEEDEESVQVEESVQRTISTSEEESEEDDESGEDEESQRVEKSVQRTISTSEEESEDDESGEESQRVEESKQVEESVQVEESELDEWSVLEEEPELDDGHLEGSRDTSKTREQCVVL